MGFPYQLCFKIDQSFDGESRIVRGCAAKIKGWKLGCIDRTGTRGVKIRYCYCKGDNCNTATLPSPSNLFVMCLFGIFFMMF